MPSAPLSVDRVGPRDSKAMRDLVAVVSPALIVEFGSWEGRSALTFLVEAERLGIGTEIICVDTWLGSLEHWANQIPNSEWAFERLRLSEGEPRVLETFWETIGRHGFLEKTSIVRASTRNAAPFLENQGVKPGLVYVDADHSFQAVSQDLRLARSLCGSGGVISGDDFAWHSVRLAIGMFVRKSDTVMSSEGQFVVLNETQKVIRQGLRDRGWKIERLILLREFPRVLVRCIPQPVRKRLDRLRLQWRNASKTASTRKP